MPVPVARGVEPAGCAASLPTPEGGALDLRQHVLVGLPVPDVTDVLGRHTQLSGQAPHGLAGVGLDDRLDVLEVGPVVLVSARH